MKIIKFSLFVLPCICAFALKSMQKSADRITRRDDSVYTDLRLHNSPYAPGGVEVIFIKYKNGGSIACYTLNRNGFITSSLLSPTTGRMPDGRTPEEVFAELEETYNKQQASAQASLALPVGGQAVEEPSRSSATSAADLSYLRGLLRRDRLSQTTSHAADAATAVCSASLSSSSSSTSASSTFCPVDPCPATEQCVMTVGCMAGEQRVKAPSQSGAAASIADLIYLRYVSRRFVQRLPLPPADYFTFSAGRFVKGKFVRGVKIPVMKPIAEE